MKGPHSSWFLDPCRVRCQVPWLWSTQTGLFLDFPCCLPTPATYYDHKVGRCICADYRVARNSVAASCRGHRAGPWHFLKICEGNSGEHRCHPLQTVARGFFQKVSLLRTLSCAAWEKGPQRGRELWEHAGGDAQLGSWRRTDWRGFSRAPGDPAGGCKERPCLEFSLS